MRSLTCQSVWSRHLLSLILLTANVGAPFSTSDAGRMFLKEAPARNAATSMVVRVRGVCPVGTSLGFRAVVGLSTGGPDRPSAFESGRPVSTWVPCSTAPLASPHRARPADRANTPLRC